VVFAHGIGDSCYNDGFLRLLQRTRDILGNDVYVTCIPTADNQQDDTKNGFFLNWNASVDVFHSKVNHDDRLKDGFHAIGLSQGANLIRGYIAKYNDPTVHTFIALNGVNAGIGAVPYCRQEPHGVTMEHQGISHSLCDLLQEQASWSAYNCFAQHHSFPANYWRDPRIVAAERYQIYSQLAWFNQEGYDLRDDFKRNWNKTQKFVWVLAEDDDLVWPREGEWWGAPDPRDPFNKVLEHNETRWYRDDLFGLRSAEEAGKNYYESFPGDHLKFSRADYERWIKKYIRDDGHDDDE
jgi:palmitoyl-protein thioesterase